MSGKPGPRPASGQKTPEKQTKKPHTYLLFKKQNLSLNRSREDRLRPKPVYSSTPADRCSLNEGKILLVH